MKTSYIDPTGKSYSEAIVLTDYNRLVFVSGQIPVSDQEHVPEDFYAQCELVWQNISKRLESANMTLNNIIKITTYLSDRKYREENYLVRTKVLGAHQPALTVIITGIYDEKWLLEIEVIAAE